MEDNQRAVLLFVPGPPAYISGTRLRGLLEDFAPDHFAQAEWRIESMSGHRASQPEQVRAFGSRLVVLCLLTAHVWRDEEINLIAALQARCPNLVLLVYQRRPRLASCPLWRNRTNLPAAPPAVLVLTESLAQIRADAVADAGGDEVVPLTIRAWAALSLGRLRTAFESGVASFSGLSEEHLDLLTQAELGKRYEVSFEVAGRRYESAEVTKVYPSENEPKRLLCGPEPVRRFIWKQGDNIYHDQACLGMMRAFNEIWRTLGTTVTWRDETGRVHSEPVRCRIYDVYPLEGMPVLRTALIEHVRGTTIAPLWDRNMLGLSYRTVWNDYASYDDTSGNSYTLKLATAVGSFIACYVLAVGDRHQDNMMLDAAGAFFNIDFQYWGGETTFPDTGDLPLPWGFVTMLTQSGMWPEFVEVCWQALTALQAFAEPLLALLAEKVALNPGHQRKTLATVGGYLAPIAKEQFVERLHKGKYLALPKNVLHHLGQEQKKKKRKEQQQS
jgi:hypothetical protein